MKAVVIGATGAVGKDLVRELLKDPAYTEVAAFTRRELALDDRKLRVHVVDFERPEGWSDLVRGDVLFSALGTSKKEAGSKEAQYHVDYDYTMLFARFAKKQGVRHVVLVSSMGAAADSGFFYLRMKGEIERDIEALGFPALTIIQPPSLIREKTKRPLEGVSVKLLQAANALGLFKKIAPVSTRAVAICMAKTGKENTCGLRKITGQAILKTAP